MLDQNAEEPLDGAVQRAMHHQRLMLLAVLGDVFELEAPRQREIELHGGKLPQPPDRVHQFHVDLRAVKRRFVRHHLHLHVQPFGGALQRVFGELPLLGRAVVLAACAAVPGGKLGFVFVEAEGLQRIDGELQAAHHFVFDLLRRAENMRVVLRESAHAHQPVHHARSLVAIHRAQFAQPHRQIAIAVQLVACKSGCGRGSSWA